MEAFQHRDLANAESLVELDELIDRANRRTVEHVLDLGGDVDRREWGLRMLLVSRCLERIGDHAVDIGEQTAYLVTGEFREFTDASHPEAQAFVSARAEDRGPAASRPSGRGRAPCVRRERGRRRAHGTRRARPWPLPARLTGAAPAVAGPAAVVRFAFTGDIAMVAGPAERYFRSVSLDLAGDVVLGNLEGTLTDRGTSKCAAGSTTASRSTRRRRTPGSCGGAGFTV